MPPAVVCQYVNASDGEYDNAVLVQAGFAAGVILPEGLAGIALTILPPETLLETELQGVAPETTQ